MIQNLINHIVYELDDSGSMGPHRAIVPKVFDADIARLKQRSVELGQETRVSVYLFGDTVTPLVYDMDVMRMPSIAQYYKAGDGSTALLDGVAQAIEDMRKTATLYGDHAFLSIAITDGQENSSRRVNANHLRQLLTGLGADWTVAIMVPDSHGVFEAKKLGFAPDSIAIWDVTSHVGFESAMKRTASATESYMMARARGTRGTKSFFAPDVTAIPQTAMAIRKAGLTELDPSTYRVYDVRMDGRIDDTVEAITGKPYRKGSTYHVPVKRIKLQDDKEILLFRKKDGHVFEGKHVRTLLGLPPQTVDIDPVDYASDWLAFVQSNSDNRKVFRGQQILVRG